jgi:uncharacterized protein YuzE
MRLKIDRTNDTLYLRLGDTEIVDSEEVEPGVILDFARDSSLVGIEILSLSMRMSPEELGMIQVEIA